MKRKLSILIIAFIIVFIYMNQVYNSQCFAGGHLDIEGWELLENKEKLALWQKGGEDFTSEVILNLSTAIGSELLRGYTIKKTNKKLLSDYLNNNYPLGIWKIIYEGFDSSGNIYLEVIRENEEINISDQNRLIEEIKNINSIEDEKNIIEKRLELFDSTFNRFLKREGNHIIVDPAKILIINSISCIPPLKIEVNKKHSVINVILVNLD